MFVAGQWETNLRQFIVFGKPIETPGPCFRQTKGICSSGSLAISLTIPPRRTAARPLRGSGTWSEQPLGPQKTSFCGRVRRFAPAASNRPSSVLNQWSVFSKAGPATLARTRCRIGTCRYLSGTRNNGRKKAPVEIDQGKEGKGRIRASADFRGPKPGEGRGRTRPGEAADPPGCPGC